MAKIIAVALKKGGVGKTTTAQHLAHGLAMRDRKVLLVDLDAQGSTSQRYDLSAGKGTLSDVLGTNERPPSATLKEVITPTYQKNLWLVAAGAELVGTNRRMASDQLGVFRLDKLFREENADMPFDYIVLDTAPGDSTLLHAALVAADEVIVPVQVSPMGFEGFEGIDDIIVQAREAQQVRGGVRLRYRAVLPTFYSQGEIISDGFLEALREAEHPDYEGEPLPLAPLPVPETTAFEKASLPDEFPGGVIHARTIFEMPVQADGDPTSRGQQAYLKLAEMVDEYR